jgi:hypothetical protein
MGTEAELSDEGVQQTNSFDLNALSTQGFGQNTGNDVTNIVDECGMHFEGTSSTDETTIIM